MPSPPPSLRERIEEILYGYDCEHVPHLKIASERILTLFTDSRKELAREKDQEAREKVERIVAAVENSATIKTPVAAERVAPVAEKVILAAIERGRLSGIKEMASRGRKNIERIIGSPAVWCFEEVCKDRTCPTCKAGWKFQNDIEPAIYASLDQALKDLIQ